MHRLRHWLCARREILPRMREGHPASQPIHHIGLRVRPAEYRIACRTRTGGNRYLRNPKVAAMASRELCEAREKFSIATDRPAALRNPKVAP